jgi:hypothetical protein
MAELYRLLAIYVCPSVICRAIYLSRHPERCHRYEDAAEDAQLGERVCAVVKDLGHRFPLRQSLTTQRKPFKFCHHASLLSRDARDALPPEESPKA